MAELPEHWRWFPESRFGLFIHWGAYSLWGRGEQVLFREHLDQRAYADRACRWNPQHFDAAAWAAVAKRAGIRYAVLTARHHDGFCLWDSAFTDYSTAAQAPQRDFVREYVEAFRAAGLRVGLYYSLADWRIPAYWDGPDRDPEGWDAFRTYVHNQVRELMTNHGPIDVFWADGAWPHDQRDWGSLELVAMMRELHPHILISNRLGVAPPDAAPAADGGLGAGEAGCSVGTHPPMGDVPGGYRLGLDGRQGPSAQGVTLRRRSSGRQRVRGQRGSYHSRTFAWGS